MNRYIISTAAALLLILPLPASGKVRNNPDEGKPKSGKEARPKKEKAPEDTLFTDEYLDTVQVSKQFSINDYTAVGLHYGLTINNTVFNPPYSRKSFNTPGYMGVFVTRYGKMFGFMPYFGIKFGLAYGQEGYEFRKDPEDFSVQVIEGASKVQMNVIEMPLLAHFHYDLPYFKILADLGLYGGYRLDIHREGPNGVSDDVRDSFMPYDRRIDYGLQGGGGFAAVFDPFEFHITANVRYSWSSLWVPDTWSRDYYRFGYPFDVVISAGIYFQLTKRTGKTKHMLRNQARQIVFEPAPEKEASENEIQ